MIRKIKYIRYPSGFVIFSEPMTHKEIHVRDAENPISAGFVSLNYDQDGIKASCHGSSISMGLDSKEDDSELLTKQLRGFWS